MYARKYLTTAFTAAALLFSGATFAQNVASEPVSDGGVTPYVIPGANPGGNRTCAEVGVAFFGNATYYRCWSAQNNYDSDTDSFALGFEDVSGNELCDRNLIDVTVTDDTFVSFEAFPDGVGAALIKGGNDTNVYVYEPQVFSDSGLASPPNASGDPAGLSNIGGFCWNPLPEDRDEDPECYEGETAWSAGSRYTARGNWATHTSYSGVEKTVVLWAGQNMDAGDVTFSAPVAGVVTITIQLNEGWRFALNPVGEEGGFPVFDNNIKVQHYASAPSGNPAPGLFQWKTFAEGDFGEIEVPAANFYGVHVDVEKLVDCPE